MLLKELYNIFEAPLSNVSQRQQRWDNERANMGDSERGQRWAKEHNDKRMRQANKQNTVAQGRAGKLSQNAQQLLAFARKNPRFVSNIMDMLVGVKNAGMQMERVQMLERINSDANNRPQISPQILQQIWTNMGKPTSAQELVPVFQKAGLSNDQISQAFGEIGVQVNLPKEAAPQEAKHKVGQGVAGGMDPEMEKKVSTMISNIAPSEKRMLVKQLRAITTPAKDQPKPEAGESKIILPPGAKR